MHKPGLLGLCCDGCCKRGLAAANFLGCGHEPCPTWCTLTQEGNDSVSFLLETEAIFHGTIPYRPHSAWFTRSRHGNKNFSCVEKSRQAMGKSPKLGRPLCTCGSGVLELDQYLKRKILTVAASAFCYPKPVCKQEIYHNE